MAYESDAEPVKLGYLFDFKLPDGYLREMRDDLTRPFELVFREGMEQGLIDRPVQIVFREVEGQARLDGRRLPRGAQAGPGRRHLSSHRPVRSGLRP